MPRKTNAQLVLEKVKSIGLAESERFEHHHNSVSYRLSFADKHLTTIEQVEPFSTSTSTGHAATTTSSVIKTGDIQLSTGLPSAIPTNHVYEYDMTFGVENVINSCYSVLDYIAHEISLLYVLPFNIDTASFKRVESHLKSTYPNTRISKTLTRISDSKYFEELDAYRNSNSHVFTIKIKSEVQSTSSGLNVTPLMPDAPKEVPPQYENKIDAKMKSRYLLSKTKEDINRLYYAINRDLKNQGSLPLSAAHPTAV